MKKALNIIRALFIALAVMLIAFPVSLYVILSTSWAQDSIRRVANNELSALLATEVSIGRIEIHPFNSISIYNITALDDYGHTALEIEEISAAFELFHLMRTGHLVIDYAMLYRPAVSLSKESKDSPLNIAKILNALKSDRKDKHQSRYDLKVNTVVIRKGSLKFDINNVAPRDSLFDPAHIVVSDIYINSYIPRISNSEYRVEIDHFSFKELSGFELTNLTAAAAVKADGSKLERLKIELPSSVLDFAPASVDNRTVNSLLEDFRNNGIAFGVKAGSTIYPPDLKAFAPMLEKLSFNIGLSLSGRLSSHEVSVNNLILSTEDNNIHAIVNANLTGTESIDDATISDTSAKFFASSEGIKSLLKLLERSAFTDHLTNSLRVGDNFSANINASGPLKNILLRTDIDIADNTIRLRGHINCTDSFRSITYRTEGMIDFNNLALFLSPQAPTATTARLKANGKLIAGNPSFDLSLDSTKVTYQGYQYGGISLEASYSKSDIEASLNIFNDRLQLQADCNSHLDHHSRTIDAALQIDRIDIGALSKNNRFEGFSLSSMIDTQLEFSDIDDIDGSFSISDLCLSDGVTSTPDLKLSTLTVNARPSGDSPGIEINSDYINGYINGPYRLSTLYPTLCEMVHSIFPSIDAGDIVLSDHDLSNGENNFTFSFQVNECEEACKFLRLPISVIHTVGINGHISDVFHTASVNIDAPYLLQGDKIIESTRLTSSLDAGSDLLTLFATTKMPTKKGPMTVSANLNGATDCIKSQIDWSIERKIPINGAFDFTTRLNRNDDDKLGIVIGFNPGTITFGSDVWAIRPSSIDISDNRIAVEKFSLEADDKSISIDGIVSDNENDYLRVALKQIALLEIFETLEIDKALIGGTATGTFIGHRLLSPEPEITCRKLHVDDISYNRCILGNADIAAFWDNNKKSFNLDADIIGATGLHSRIFGDIFPLTESLDINFDVKHTPVGFLKPFMSAFASDLEGYASGTARLFGTFKYIDMEGDIYADNLRIKIDFTNTWYTATDSIHLRPGNIEIKDITIRDINGQTALLNGYVGHKFFKEPSFKFDITEAKDFLSYDVDSRLSANWYGTIYGNGSASISGEPGVVNIGVNMSTAPHSVFTFVLSNRLDADEYSFITFTDRRAEARRDSILAEDNVPEAVRTLMARLDAQDNEEPSAYNMDLQIDINPNARMTLVMDPVAGDEIKATGDGNLRMSYQSLNNDLKMYGTYTLDRGNYNFTLQDIIIKDFSIRQGSTISFFGDPYSAQLNIKAIYSVNANLSDLDESFLLDKDLNRTNVPVHALLLVKGDMRQPDIDFDLEFPTLTQDTYRKVRSIISTREMMNRQIIYLLALNRFYTPDYMASTTKGNELFSVASSTISSQLGNMLGKLSDDWSISPNLRSDRGDFSDVEVDVALSSRLLNNRLLFNGNFGYRDKTLNTNQFIGDFDIEYLLNPKGNWRLKAYNRYNDQNYYVRTAQTTQGIGLVFKRDFNDFFGFLRHKKKSETVSEQSDSTTADVNTPTVKTQEIQEH